jgi:sterol desaturase/sphingolipid hydroxylase (fatty acid hydroxylase superfamily)
MAQTQPQKLNLFQRGILQKVATAIVYFASFVTGAFILDWLEKRRFTVVAEKAQQQGILTPESFRDLKAQIAAMDVTAIFAIIIVGLFCVGIGWLLMRWAANLNWSWPVTLPKAVEFRSAMRMVNISDSTGEIECVRKHPSRLQDLFLFYPIFAGGFA